MNMLRRSALALSVAAALALPATASASASASDPLAAVKQCQQEIGWTVAALMWGEWQRPDCP